MLYFQKINFNAEIDICCCSGRSGSNEKLVNFSVAAIKTQGCGKNSCENIRANLEIPPIPPTDFTTSGVLSVSYFLRVGDNLNS